jgi:hypothetical protein
MRIEKVKRKTIFGAYSNEGGGGREGGRTPQYYVCRQNVDFCRHI